MAAAQKLGKQVAGCNYVANDEIWKSHVNMEWSASKKWPQNWGFMTTSYKDLANQVLPPKTEVSPKVELPESLQPPPITPIEKYIKIGQSPAYPDTSTGFVGWRSTKGDCSLEIYGSYAKGKGGLIKQLNWPHEAIS
jgi:hypothetical protein